jgi:hypothetical protein
MTGNITMLNIGLLVGSFTMTGKITIFNTVILPVLVKEPTRRPISTL